MPRHPTVLLTGLLICLLLSGCSSTRLAYNQASWWAPWVARDYIPLDSSQRSLLRSQVNTLRDWHCESEIPRYSDWLEQRRQDLGNARPGEAQLQLWLDELLAAYQTTTSRLLAPAAELLATLDDEQVERLQHNLAEKNRELEEQYREPPLADQISERESRLTERLEGWFGEINTEQRYLIGDWSQDRGNQNSGWLDNRLRWQQQLFSSLEQRDSEAAFTGELATLLLSPQTLHSPEYQRQSEQARSQGITLATALLASADEAQIDHLQAELASLQRRIDALDCR